MSTRRHRQPLRMMSDINVTNLLDTAFILVIALILVAPHLNQGVKLDLPTAEAPALNTEPKKTFLISVKPAQEGQSEQIIVNEQRISADDLYKMVLEEKNRRPDLVVTIEGDKNVSYGFMYEVLAAVKQAGVENVDLPSQPGGSQEEEKEQSK